MRKTIVLIFLLSLLVLLVGCNGFKPSTDDTTPTPHETNKQTIQQASDSNSNKTDVSITSENDNKESQIELDDVVKVYQTASEAAAWFRIASLLENGSQDAIDTSTQAVYNGLNYYRVMKYNSYSEFIEYLGTFFSDGLIEEFLSYNGTMYVNHNGYLYGRLGMRGTNIFMGAESYEIEYVNDSKVHLLVKVEVMSEDLSSVKEYQTFIFPYENMEGNWVFTDFPEIR